MKRPHVLLDPYSSLTFRRYACAEHEEKPTLPPGDLNHVRVFILRVQSAGSYSEDLAFRTHFNHRWSKM